MSFKDHFSGHADRYQAHRPTYPEALYDYLASLAPGHDLAWDCATGNGQAAHGLVPHFRASSPPTPAPPRSPRPGPTTASPTSSPPPSGPRSPTSRSIW